MPESCQQEENKAEARLPNGRWKKGVSGNPAGKNGFMEIAGLVAALEDESKRRNYPNFNAYVAERAFNSDEILKAVLNKVYPQKTEHDHSGEIVVTKEAVNQYVNRISRIAAIN